MKLLPACFLLSALSLTQAFGQESVESEAVHSVCAAANAILTTQMDEGILREFVQSEARRHSDIAIIEGATQDDLKQFVTAMTLAYNNQEMSWDKISALGKSCAEL